MRVDAIERKTVAIVSFGPLGRCDDGTWPIGMGFAPGQFFQVTVDPDKRSPDGEFIRFGTYPGDELVGWQLVSAMTVVSVLGEWNGDEPPVLHYGSGGVTSVEK